MRLGNGVFVVPFITPGYAFGRSTTQGIPAMQGSHFVLAGGAGLQIGPVVGLNIGARRIFAADATTLLGFGVTIAASP
jgi:hypothetical protein